MNYNWKQPKEKDDTDKSKEPGYRPSFRNTTGILVAIFVILMIIARAVQILSP